MKKIYQLTNIHNNLVYVGQTSKSIEKRLQKHSEESKRQRALGRPFYQDIAKYGIQDFEVKILEECEDSFGDLREIYWINKLDCYENGYNLSLGGKGRAIITEKEKQKVISFFLQNSFFTLNELHSILRRDREIIKRILIEAKVIDDNYFTKLHNDNIKREYSKPLIGIEKETNKRLFFRSREDAGKFLKTKTLSKMSIHSLASRIGQVCSKKRNSCYGFKFFNVHLTKTKQSINKNYKLKGIFIR